MKRIHIETQGERTSKVLYDSDWQEYLVRLYIRGALHAPADYHTGDKSDAISTAVAMVRPNGSAKVRPVSLPFNIAVLHIVSRVLPCGFDVSPIAPQDFDSLIAHHAKTGRVLVWNGASEKTIFADSEVNFAFRAWHDSKHIIGRFPFDRAGELSAMEMQISDIRAIYNGTTADLFCGLLRAEIQGQFDYREKHGGFPIEQAAFARAYLVSPEAAAGSSPAFGISAEVIGPSWKTFAELDRDYAN